MHHVDKTAQPYYMPQMCSFMIFAVVREMLKLSCEGNDDNLNLQKINWSWWTKCQMQMLLRMPFDMCSTLAMSLGFFIHSANVLDSLRYKI